MPSAVDSKHFYL